MTKAMEIKGIESNRCCFNCSNPYGGDDEQVKLVYHKGWYECPVCGCSTRFPDEDCCYEDGMRYWLVACEADGHSSNDGLVSVRSQYEEYDPIEGYEHVMEISFETYAAIVERGTYRRNYGDLLYIN